MQIQVNQIILNYELSGNQDGQVVVLSHSLGSNLSMWDFQLAALEQDFRVLRYDSRGHGGSQATTGAYTLDLLGDDALALLDALNIPKVHWVGLSMGGIIGQNIALRVQDRLYSLSLCDTMAQVPKAAQSTWQERIGIARTKGLEALVDGTMERWFTSAYRKQQPPALKLIRQYFVNTSLDGYIGSAEAISQLDYLEQLDQIKVPTLIMAGEQDGISSPEVVEAMQARISNAKVQSIPDAAHLANVEQPEEFNRLLLEFLHTNSG